MVREEIELSVVDLLDRPLYGFGQIDSLVGLTSGTARRWIDGYARAGKSYLPVIRNESSGEEIVTWGEFVETQFLSGYRDAGVPLVRMRPAIQELRKRYATQYPLAHAHPFLQVDGKELVHRVQDDVGLDTALYLVIVRSGQLVLAPHAEQFVRSVSFDSPSGIAERVYPLEDQHDVVIDPLRQFGLPAVRSVRTEVIAELMRAGEPGETIEDAYELSRSQVEAAIRYELKYGIQPSNAA